jgi:DNA polymerase-3 subunit delta
MIYFLHGDTAPLQLKYEEILDKIKSNNPSIPEKVFDASLDEVTLFFDSVSTNSIFSPKELIILKRAESFKNLEGIAKSLKLYNLTQKEIIIVYEEFLNDFGKIKNPIPKKTLDSFKDIAEIICFRKENEKKAIVFYLQEELSISEYEAEKFIELVGDDFFKVKNEVEKVKNFLDGETFNIDKIKPVLSIAEEFNLKNLIENFILSRNAKELLYFLQKEKLYTNFLYTISDELIFYLKLLSLSQGGVIDKNISYKRFNEGVFENIKEYFITDRGYPHPYTLFLKLKNIDLFDLDFLKEKLKEIMYLEYNIKSGNLDMDIGVETFILGFYK